MAQNPKQTISLEPVLGNISKFQSQVEKIAKKALDENRKTTKSEKESIKSLKIKISQLKEIERAQRGQNQTVNKLNSELVKQKKIQEGQVKAVKKQYKAYRALGNGLKKLLRAPWRAIKSLNRVVWNLRMAFQSLLNPIKQVGLSVAGLVGSFIGLKFGAKDVASGMSQIMKLRANQHFLDIANSIVAATSGMVDFDTAIDVARRTFQLGLPGNKYKTTVNDIGQLAAITFAKMQNSGKTLNETINILMQTVASATARSKGIMSLDPELGKKVKEWLEINKHATLYQKRMGIINIYQEHLNGSLKEQSSIFKGSFARMTGFFKFLTEKSGGILEMFEGFGKIGAGLGAPLFAGIQSIFSGNLISGGISTMVGASLTATLTAVFGKVMSKVAGDVDGESKGITESIMGAFTAASVAIQQFFGTFFSGLGGLGEDEDVLAKGANEKALKEYDKSVKKINKTLGGSVLPTSQELAKKGFKWGKAFKKFTDDFFGEIEENMPHIKAAFTSIKQGVFDLIGLEKSGSTGKFFANLVVSVVEGFSHFIGFLNKLKILQPVIKGFFYMIFDYIGDLIRSFGDEKHIERLNKAEKKMFRSDMEAKKLKTLTLYKNNQKLIKEHGKDSDEVRENENKIYDLRKDSNSKMYDRLNILKERYGINLHDIFKKAGISALAGGALAGKYGAIAGATASLVKSAYDALSNKGNVPPELLEALKYQHNYFKMIEEQESNMQKLKDKSPDKKSKDQESTTGKDGETALLTPEMFREASISASKEVVLALREVSGKLDIISQMGGARRVSVT